MFAFLGLVPRVVLYSAILALTLLVAKLGWDNRGLAVELGESKLATANAEAETAQVRADHLVLVAASQAEFAKSLQAMRDKEQSLQDAMDKQRRKLNETNTALTIERDSMRLRYKALQDRYNASTNSADPSKQPKDTGAGQATGIDYHTELSNPIGDLIEEATRADTIRNALLMCYKSYDDAKNKLESKEVSK